MANIPTSGQTFTESAFCFREKEIRPHIDKSRACYYTITKKFIGEILGLTVDDRLEGTGATVALGISKGANIVRVHDVKPMARIARMTDAMLSVK